MHRRFLKNYRNIATDSLLVAQIASALSNRKVLLPHQFIASLLDESAEKKDEKKKKEKQNYLSSSSISSPPPPLLALLKYSRTSSKR